MWSLDDLEESTTSGRMVLWRTEMTTYQESRISVNAAAKKYGIPQRTLARWAEQGKIKVLVHPERHG